MAKIAVIKIAVIYVIACTAFGLIGLAPGQTATAGTHSGLPQLYGSWGFDLMGSDTASNPGDNFFRYANGGYLDRLIIPADRSGYSTATVLTEASEAAAHKILQEASKEPFRTTTAEQRVGAYYAAFMDEDRVDRLGSSPMQNDPNQIRNAKSRRELARLMGSANKGFGGSIFDLSIETNAKDPSHYAIYIGQSGLGLPNREYYLDRQFSFQKAQYELYIAQLLRLIAWPDAEAQAEAVLQFETAIARVSSSKAAARDPGKSFNLRTLSQLEREAPGFPWHEFLKAADLGSANYFVVADKTAIPQIASICRRTPLSTLRAWHAFTLTDHSAPFLARQFSDAAFRMRGTILTGQQQQRARWNLAVRLVSGGNNLSRMEDLANMDDAVGRLYVSRYFSEAAKARVEAMAGEIKSALHARIEKLDWMSSETRAEALKKLDACSIEVGYPREWRDYSGLTIRADDLFGDVKRAAAFNWTSKVSHLADPANSGEWRIAPQTVNAYAYAPLNQIVLTAALLQPPVFNPDADQAVNAGGIGAILGHELTHGFDDVGRHFDAHGRLRDWWTTEDNGRFEARAAKLGAQFATCEALPGVHINSQLTMGENIADLGGLVLALDAYHASLHGRAAPVLDSLTGDQRFFLGFAQVRRGKQRPEALRHQVVADPHAPDECRVNYDVRNIDEWYDAFHVESAQKLYLATRDRAHIW